MVLLSFSKNADHQIVKSVIPFSRLESRLFKLQSLFRDWDRDFKNTNPFFESGIETFKMPIPFFETGIETQKWKGLL